MVRSKFKRVSLMIAQSIMIVAFMLITFFGILCFVFNICYMKTHVIGYSMYPTLNAEVQTATERGDEVYINKFRELKVGDIVSANVEWWSSGPIIKRLVAVGGDKLQVEETSASFVLKNNGEEVYTVQKTANSVAYYNRFVENMPNFGETGTTDEGEKYVIIQEDKFFLMSDNWAEAMVDCTTYGGIERENIIGGVDIILKQNENKIHLLGKMLKLVF